MADETRHVDITQETERLTNAYDAGKMQHDEFSTKMTILRLLNDRIGLQAQAMELAEFYEHSRIAHLIRECLLGSHPACDVATIETHFKAIEEEADFDLWSPFFKANSKDELQALFAEPEKGKTSLAAELGKAEACFRELKEKLRLKADREGKESFEMYQMRSRQT